MFAPTSSHLHVLNVAHCLRYYISDEPPNTSHVQIYLGPMGRGRLRELQALGLVDVKEMDGDWASILITDLGRDFLAHIQERPAHMFPWPKSLDSRS